MHGDVGEHAGRSRRVGDAEARRELAAERPSMDLSHAAERNAKRSLTRRRRVEIANVAFVDQLQERVNSSTREDVFERYDPVLRYADVER